ERESFEDASVAAIMNEHFVNIKVDREERPDVDHIYMDAVQAISGSGGWPLNVFLTPEKKAFYGGTYFPPTRAFNRASWKEVLLAIDQAYRNSREDLEEQATRLMEHIRTANATGRNTANAEGLFTQAAIDDAFANIMKTADREWGGFGQAPKFPQTFTINFLLHYAHLTKDQEALQQACLTLDRMIRGGIYDHVGGGFARYATDTEWLVPHFEKMLYDNALMVITLSDAYKLTRDEAYLEVIHETLEFTRREMTHESGGFFSALDADSEGAEGKFYVWSYDEVTGILGADADIFCDYFDITPGGNWEGHNILRVKKPGKAFAALRGISEARLREIIQIGKKLLLERRSGRIRPQLDDKIILGWNALMSQAFIKAWEATGNRNYLETARRNVSFLLQTFRNDGRMKHTWKAGRATQPAFLDDYSYLIATLLELAQATGELDWLEQAEDLAGEAIAGFADDGTPFFFYTHENQDDVPIRKQEIYDGATPSGNAVMAASLHRLAIVFDRADWRERAAAMVQSMGEVIVRFPTSFGVWLSLLYELTRGTSEIAIIGRDWKIFLEKLLGNFISHKLALASEKPMKQYPLLADKPETGEIRIYLCQNYACQKPVFTIPDLLGIL
ncbi:MAG TPA: thioredoxin domain-containing protein, partial [Flavisolibacter sp.]